MRVPRDSIINAAVEIIREGYDFSLEHHRTIDGTIVSATFTSEEDLTEIERKVQELRRKRQQL